MSFIGPRPITTNRPLEEYDEKRKIRLLVRPGITGYSQAYYRNSIDQETKLEYDAKYAENVTFFGDIKIILKIYRYYFKKKKYIYEQGENYG
ncbi:Putative colanic biosynthesis UDP-glucose lipid carrier transferase [Fusobacterium necrophorum subsp. necrophorum]|nr:Putative colanic biosynthesis UDP-glucose lipid carrier transferase [Fusobacterium necrophorum subsp. necrophorum]